MEKQRALPKGEAAVEINEYYIRISKKLRNTKYLMLLLMVAALILTLWAYRSRLTYDNLRYILRDIDEAGHTTLSSDAVYYSASDTNFYLNFRGDLAVASASGIEFHRALGSRSFEDEVNFKSPILTGSDKYMIAYDTGANSFYVYNSISRVYSETLKHKIIDCAAADNGNFAVLTKSDVGDCVVRIYDKDFALVGEVTRAGYAYSVSFLNDGRLCIFESVSSGASLLTEILLYTVGTTEIDCMATVSGIALECDSMGDGVAVVSSLGVTVFDYDMNEKKYYTFGTSDVRYGSVTKRGVCAMLDKNEVGADEEAVVYLADGSVKRCILPYGARGITLLGDNAVVLYDDRIINCNGEIYEIVIPDGAKKLLYLDDKSVIACYNDYAKVFEVK